MEARLSVRVAGSPEGVQRAGDDLEAFFRANQLPAGAVWPFRLVLDEMLSNTLRYGYGARSEGREVEVQFHLRDGVLELTLVDDGEAFDPLAAPEPVTTGPAEGRPIGGLGIFLVKKLMDSVLYERREGRNRLVCRRKVEV